jgi:NDP-sugar pyrophosphorylase family protein
LEKTLLILAAGLGSRFGGLKQIEEIGPHGEIIMDYSIHDALNAGFNRVVLIVKEEMIAILTERYVNKKQLPITFVVQENIIKINENLYENNKPWGTAFALWCARDKIKTNFLLINADDFYGRESFTLAFNHLSQNYNPCAITFPVYKTLSKNGTVNRAEIFAENNFLTKTVEREKISYSNQELCYVEANGKMKKLKKDTLVSMNMWVFTPQIFSYISSNLSAFINNWKTNHALEYQLPHVVDEMIKKENYKIKIITTNEEWIGVTYQEDKHLAKQLLKKLHLEGKYNASL